MSGHEPSGPAPAASGRGFFSGRAAAGLAPGPATAVRTSPASTALGGGPAIAPGPATAAVERAPAPRCGGRGAG
ncbi:hypothetical protein [Actinomyces israelii]|uniref:hypothetical protein n=1 Tax=Actinomyces israelii TaxID=1659 RepID=UPI000693C344|nr:hypothetical protein [Actinomyces israelii]